jgi:hypothetical protein
MGYKNYPLDVLCKLCIETELTYFWHELEDVTPRFIVEVPGGVNSERVCLYRQGGGKDLLGTHVHYSKDTDTTTVMVTCKELRVFLAQDMMVPEDIIGYEFGDHVNKLLQRPHRFVVTTQSKQ